MTHEKSHARTKQITLGYIPAVFDWRVNWHLRWGWTIDKTDEYHGAFNRLVLIRTMVHPRRNLLARLFSFAFWRN